MTAIVRRPGAWLVALVAGLLAYCAIPVPAGMVNDEPPVALVAEVMKHTIVTMDTCSLVDLGLTSVECIASYDNKLKRSWLILFDDDLKMTMVVLFDGATHVLWCKATVCT